MHLYGKIAGFWYWSMQRVKHGGLFMSLNLVLKSLTVIGKARFKYIKIKYNTIKSLIFEDCETFYIIY